MTQAPIGSDPKSGWEIELASPDQVHFYWPQISGMLEKLRHTIPNYTIEALYQFAMDQRIQVWLVGRPEIKLVMFTQVAVFPKLKVLEVIWGAGEGALGSQHIVEAVLDNFARGCGCERIDVFARPGWEKVMAPFGFKRTSIKLSRPVHPGRSQ
jgi:hypothetical protein